MKKGGIREMFFRISAFVVSTIMLIGIIFFPFSSINATNISQTFTIPQKGVESHIHLAKGFRFRSRPFRTYRQRPRYRAPRIRPPRIRPPKIRVPRARTPSIKRRFNTRSGIKNKGLFRRNHFKPIRRALSKNLGFGRKIAHRAIPKKLFRQALKRKNRRQAFKERARQYAKAKWTRARSKLKNSIKSSRNLFVASVGLRRFMRPQKPVRLAGLKRAMTARIKTAKLLLPKHRLRINNKRSINLLKPSIRSRIISKSLFKGKTKTGFWKRTFTSNKKNNLNRKSAKAELFANKTIRNSKLNFAYNKIRRSKTALAVNKKPGFWSKFWGKKTNKIANTKSQKTKTINRNKKVLAKKKIKQNVTQKKLVGKNAVIKTTKLNNKKLQKEKATISRKQVAVKDTPKLLKEARGPPKEGVIFKKAKKKFDRERYRFFIGNNALKHFKKHSQEFMTVFNVNSYNLKNYIDDAHNVIKNGKYVPELNGFVRLIGGKGKAKYGFVGLNDSGELTTFHIKTASELARKAPSLGISK